MKRSKGLFFLLVFCAIHCLAQQQKQEVQIAIQPVFGSSPIKLESEFYRTGNGDSIQFETIRFYISAIAFVKNEQTVWREENSFHLVDLTESNTLNILLKPSMVQSFDRIRFIMGIDSLTNVSGAIGGDLDPTKGMYWTWDNGYINAKIEGKGNRTPTRNHEFQLHIGGYRKEVNTAHEVILPVPNYPQIRIQLDLKPVFDQLDLAKTNHIMSAGKEGVSISRLMAQNFKTE